ncbi:tripartite tricarboxylate transporter substrate-binding protein [Pollutimonas harenae]|uniref:ABC transporter substrate-binding protein n=1 Tax=Pollutimonas harenae TaxID=657015 RepID=A0A853GLZ4_9BURK|nr:tripartite tricarboxylate transporter substrate-binding protein [Pollutimonas harenae]NYT84008.1 ABC transporter substrate-binding protein [Pollutimonas harenae]TEA73566.1 ABC transporter substrate-binding protein [Pollutimonas harenae]
MIQRAFRAALLPCLLFAASSASAAQDSVKQLSEPLIIVVGYAPGGATDRAARIVADSLQDKLGVSVLVENKTGAGGRIAAQHVKNADPDDNMLLLGNPAVMVVAPLVFESLPYDAKNDFQPVSMVTEYGFGVAVSADSSIKDMKGLVDWAKTHPKQFNIGVPATGSLPHFFGLMLAQQIGTEGQIIGYRGSAPVITDLIGGAVPVAIDTLDVLTRQHQGKRIRILASSGEEREAALPDVPTFKQAGIDLQASGWNTFFASSAMPKDKAEMLGEVIKSVTADPKVRKTLQDGDLIPVSANAQETGKLVEAFRAQWAPVVKASGFVVTK